jgi:hypothetical protein
MRSCPFVRTSDAHAGGGESTSKEWIGQLDEVRLWNICRTQADLQASLFTPLLGNETGLVFYENFDAAPSLNTLVDAVGGCLLVPTGPSILVADDHPRGYFQPANQVARFAEQQKLILCDFGILSTGVCVCVRARARVRVRVCAHVCVCVFVYWG